ncbi:MAG: bifunctional [glutamine synthetase] adenylyltransferase/[glutamine synthetase]-adenylyl-L-tyrosine phosphorylase, partial [Actinomycetota bacterium]
VNRARSLALVSRTLSKFVHADERALELLQTDELPDRDGYAEEITTAYEKYDISGLRIEKRRRLAQIAALDAEGSIRLEEIGRALSDLTDACLNAVLGDHNDVAIIAMGKLGARELNYVSDIDLMFVAHDDLGAATTATEALLRALGDYSPQGRAFIIDTNLRPEGRDGPLVRSLDGYLEYYRRWAKPWEYQALLKARVAAGNIDLGETLLNQTSDLVFPQQVAPERIADMRKIKERVETHATRASRKGRDEREDVKLGPGGIRDIEFSVQLLQLVHGGADPTVRAAATLEAIGALVDGGYLAEEDGAGLSVAYRWLRTVEHRLQLHQERRVRHLPSTEDARAFLARSLGFADSPGQSASTRFETAHRNVLADVRGRFEKLFYRPMIESLAEGGPRLSEAGLKDRLRVLGFRDVDKAARTLTGLVSGTSRRSKLVRVITPAVLRFLAVSPAPDDGLFGFLRVVEALEGRYDGLGALRDNPPALAFLARLLGSGRLLAEVLVHVPDELHAVADPRGVEIKERDRLIREGKASLGWRDPAARLDGLRRFKRREFLGIAMADLSGAADDISVGASLADLADACLQATLDPDAPIAVIGMGKLGGRELNYSSDIDVMFVHDMDPRDAEKLAEELMRVIGEVTPEGQAFRIDAALRPEGKSGPLARSLESFTEYYERWSHPWEHQALIKARLTAGPEALGNRFLELAHRFAFPAEVHPDSLAEMRHLKARMERERTARGTDPRRNLKLGPGGLSDIEFAVQLLQIRHGFEHAELRSPNTIAALEAASALELLGAEDAGVLADAYRFFMRLRNRYFLLLGRPVDTLTTRPEELEALGIGLGLEDQPRQELEDAFLRTTRRVRRIAEPLLFG